MGQRSDATKRNKKEETARKGKPKTTSATGSLMCTPLFSLSPISAAFSFAASCLSTRQCLRSSSTSSSPLLRSVNTSVKSAPLLSAFSTCSLFPGMFWPASDFCDSTRPMCSRENPLVSPCFRSSPCCCGCCCSCCCLLSLLLLSSFPVRGSA